MKYRILFLFFVFLLLFISNGGYTQTTFKNLLHRTQSRGLMIEQEDSCYLLSEYGDWSGLFKLDSAGGLIYLNAFRSYHSFNYGVDGSKSFLIKTGNGNIVMPMLGNVNNFMLSLCSYNHNSKSFNWFRGYNIVDTNFIWDAVNFPTTINQSTVNGFFISTGKRTDTLYLKKFPLVVYTDSIGQVINSFRFNEHYGVAMFTHQFNDGSLISGINFTGDTVGASLVRYDTTGQVIWAKNYFGSKSWIGSSVDNHDGTITVVGFTDTAQSLPPAKQLFIMKTDLSGTIVWCKLYGDSSASFRSGPQIKATNDGGYILTGFYSNGAYPFPKSDLIIIKTDANGDTLWTRAHGNAYTEDGGQDITQTTDGGYIVCGYSSSAQFWGGGYLVIKTDSLGMTDTHCQEFNVPIAMSNVVPPDSAITLTITTGLISSVPSSVYDTTYTIQQKNGCWLSATGIEEESVHQATEFTAFPNPSAGVFTIRASDNSKVMRSFAVYDLYGHCMQTLRSAHPETILDLRSCSAGIYLVKVITGKTVQMVKVAVDK